MYFAFADMKTRKRFAVCMQGIGYQNLPVPRVVEWIELLIQLGVSRIFFSYFYLPKDIIKVLNHYEVKKIVSKKKVTFPGPISK